MADFVIRRGDTLPVFEAEFSDEDGVLDLTLAATVTMHAMRARLAVDTPVSREMDIALDPTTGQATYTFETADWSGSDFPAGAYSLEFEIVYQDGSRATAPTTGKKSMRVAPEIA